MVKGMTSYYKGYTIKAEEGIGIATGEPYVRMVITENDGSGFKQFKSTDKFIGVVEAQDWIENRLKQIEELAKGVKEFGKSWVAEVNNKRLKELHQWLTV